MRFCNIQKKMVVAVLITAFAAGCSPGFNEVPKQSTGVTVFDRIEIGMPISEFGRQTERVDPHAFAAKVISMPANLEVVLGRSSLRLENVGAPGFESSLLFADGRLVAAKIVPQSQLLPLEESLEKAKSIVAAIGESGLVERPIFADVQTATAGQKAVAGWDDVAGTLADEARQIGELSLYTWTGDSVSVALSILNPRRLREGIGTKGEVPRAAEWRLRLEMVVQS